MTKLILASAAVVSLAAGATAGTNTVEVIYSRAPSSPTSDVPGAVDLNGTPTAAKFNSMLEFWLSPDGSRFLLRGSTSQPTAESDSYLLLGSGSTGGVVLQEGRPFPGAIDAEVVDFFSSSVGFPFNANNDWAFSIRARGGASSTFNKIVRYQGMTGALRFQMGDLYTGLVDNPEGSSGDETIGNSTAAIHLLNDGRIGWDDLATQNISTTRRPVLAYDAVKYLQSRLDNVTTLDGSGPILLTNIGSTGTLSVFLTSPDGTRTVVRGNVDTDGNGSNLPADPAVVVVDGQVRIQADQEIPGQGVTPTAINQTFVAANNDWYARGSGANSTAWATRNGVVIAKTGDAIGSDTMGPTFYSIAGNSTGDWVIPARSNNADPAIDDVLVVNGQVILREGDAVSIDLDGNGTPDTAFVGRGTNTLAAFVANNSVGIAPDGTVYVLTYLHDASGADLAPSGSPYALLRITQTAACPADFNDSGAVSVQDIFDFLAAYFSNDPSADFNNSGAVSVQDIFDFLGAYFTGCP